MTRPFRFGLTLVHAPDRRTFEDAARRAEDAGWSVLNVADHFDLVAPFPALACAAGVTRRIRLGTLVVNNDWRSLAVLAQDAATVDLLSDGRLELGVGTGYAAAEYETAGYTLRPGRERVTELEATVAALRDLFGGRPATTSDTRPALTDHRLAPSPPQGDALPILVGGNGDRLLRFAARHADVVAFTGFSFPDGRTPALSHVQSDGLLDRVRLVEKVAADAGRDPERNLLLQVVAIGAPAETEAARKSVRQAYGVSDEQIDDLPVVLIGDVHQAVDKLERLRDRFGISYFAALEPRTSGFEAVLGRLA